MYWSTDVRYASPFLHVFFSFPPVFLCFTRIFSFPLVSFIISFLFSSIFLRLVSCQISLPATRNAQVPRPHQSRALHHKKKDVVCCTYTPHRGLLITFVTHQSSSVCCWRRGPVPFRPKVYWGVLLSDVVVDAVGRWEKRNDKPVGRALFSSTRKVNGVE